MVGTLALGIVIGYKSVSVHQARWAHQRSPELERGLVSHGFVHDLDLGLPLCNVARLDGLQISL